MISLLKLGTHRRSPALDDATPVEDAAFVVIDTELTGLDGKKDSIVSVGAVRMRGGRISLGDPFYRLIKPQAALTRESVIIHGITPSDLAEERDSAAVLAEFIGYCGTAVVVGHCVAIDVEFINRELKRVLGPRLPDRVLDTAELYAWMGKRQLLDRCFASPPREPGLYRLARCLDIQVAEAHNALVDAFTSAQLFQRFLPLLSESGITTVGELLRIGDPFQGSDRFRSSGEIGNF
jgi:DNA polymerase-3 subunit epsilon